MNEKQKTLAMEIGANIHEARTAVGMTQKKLAKKIKTLQPAIARVERGSVLPSFSFLLRIAKALKTEVIPPSFESLLTQDKEVADKK